MFDIYEHPYLWTENLYEVKTNFGGWDRTETWYKSNHKSLCLSLFTQVGTSLCLTVPSARLSLVQTKGEIPSMRFKVRVSAYIEKKDWELFFKCYESRQLFTMELHDELAGNLLGKYHPITVERITWEKHPTQVTTLKKIELATVLLVHR